MNEREIYRLFVRCMAAFVHGERLSLPVSMTLDDCRSLYKLAKRQSLSGALYEVTADSDLIPPLGERLRRDGFVLLTVYEQQSAIIRDIKTSFAQNGIDHLFFKGAVVRQHYQTPSMRSMGDVDVLIHEDDRQKADDVMTTLGFSCMPEQQEVWVYKKDGCLVEVHTVVRRFDVNEQTTVPYDTIWQDAALESGTTYRLSDEAEAAHTIAHLTAHFCSGGCGLRQLMDVAVWCERGADDAFWQTVTDKLAPYGMTDFIARLLWLCHEWFGVTAPSLAKPLDTETEERVLVRLLSDGTFGTDKRVLLSRMRKEQRQHHGKTHTLLRWFFVPIPTLKRQYAYAARHAWLVPVAVVHRWFDGVTKHRKIHRGRLQYAKEHEAELQTELDFFENLGL